MDKDRASLIPWGVYDAKRCGLVHIGLYADEAETWKVYLGWPHQDEIVDAKRRGLVALPLTVNYQPPRVI